jgi:hypothetical protein
MDRRGTARVAYAVALIRTKSLEAPAGRLDLFLCGHGELPSLRSLFSSRLDQLPARVGGSPRAYPHEAPRKTLVRDLSALSSLIPFATSSATVYPLPGSSGLACKRMKSPGERPYSKEVSVG